MLAKSGWTGTGKQDLERQAGDYVFLKKVAEEEVAS